MRRAPVSARAWATRMWLLVAQWCLVAALGSTPVTLAAGYGAPAGWRNVPDYPIFVDRFDGTTGRSGDLETTNGQLPVDLNHSFEGLPSLRLSVTKPTSSAISAMQILAG